MEEYIKQFLEYLLYEKGYSENTLISYKKDFEEFINFLYCYNIRYIENIDYRILHAYISEMGKSGLKPASIERKVASIKSFFKFLVKNQIVKKNPAALISSPKKDKRLPSVLEKDEIFSLINSIPDGNAISFRNKAMIMLLYASGLRVSELCGLDLKNVDFKEGIISVVGKGNKHRILPVGNTCLKVLNRYLIYRKELDNPSGDREALFLTKSGKRIQERMVRYIISAYIEALSIQKHVSPHTLRHTFATHMLENGAGIRIIQELLGHSSLSTTQVYTHLTIGKLKEDYAKHHPHA